MSAFKEGNRVFLIDGTSASYVAALSDGGHVVSLCLADNWECEEGFSATEVLVRAPRVFNEPPVREVNVEVAEAQARLDALAEQEAAARDRIAQLEMTARERHAELVKWDGFSLLEDFIAGRITHVVYVEYRGAEIKTLEDGLAYRDDRGRKEGLRLLTLFGKSNGSLTWELNCYHDGSGNNTRLYPANSYEKAVEIARGLFDADMQEIASDLGNKAYMVGQWIESAKKYGFEFPANVWAKWAENQRSNAQKQVAQAEKKLQEARSLLEKADGATTEVLP